MCFFIECPPRPLCCAVLEYARYARPHAARMSTAFIQKSPAVEKRGFSIFASQQDAEIPEHFKDGSAAEHSSAHLWRRIAL